jgi:predicted kinase
MLLVGGLMGTGKSTLAHQLSELLSAEVISSDVVRQQGDAKANNGATPSAFGEGKYSWEDRQETYLKLMTTASATFARNRAVILDATFSKQEMRKLAQELATQSAAQLVQVECECSRSEAIRRIRDRVAEGKSYSEARPELYDQQAAEAEPPLSEVPLVKVDTTLALAQQEATVLELVRDMIR